MDVSEFLSYRDVLFDIDVRDKRALLRRLAQQAAGELELNTIEIANALDEREKLVTSEAASNELAMDKRKRIVRDVQLMNGLMKESRDKIA